MSKNATTATKQVRYKYNESHNLITSIAFRPIFQSEIKGLRNIRQHVQVTGGDSMLFGSFKENMKVVYDLFSHELHMGKLEAFDLGMYEGAFAMDSHSRYFTERRLAPQETHTDIPATIDPNGILNSLRTQQFIYGPDNQVDFVYSTKEQEERMYVTTSISMITLSNDKP